MIRSATPLITVKSRVIWWKMTVCGPCYYALVRVSLKAQIELPATYSHFIWSYSLPIKRLLSFKLRWIFQKVEFPRTRMSRIWNMVFFFIYCKSHARERNKLIYLNFLFCAFSLYKNLEAISKDARPYIPQSGSQRGQVKQEDFHCLLTKWKLSCFDTWKENSVIYTLSEAVDFAWAWLRGQSRGHKWRRLGCTMGSNLFWNIT